MVIMRLALCWVIIVLVAVAAGCVQPGERKPRVREKYKVTLTSSMGAEVTHEIESIGPPLVFAQKIDGRGLPWDDTSSLIHIPEGWVATVKKLER